jgi:hypothetical protein
VERAVRRILALALAIGVVLLAPLPPVARAATPNPGAVTFTVDHRAKTITVNIKLTVYPGCSGEEGDDEQRRACASAGGQITQFLLDKIKRDIEKVWNNDNYYRCYKLIVVVDVERGTARKKVAKGRVAVRIDPSAAGIRSFVDNSGAVGNGEWRSNDPRDRVEPTNDGADETTWSESAQSGSTYAHEAGHVMGLDDTYIDVKGADGKTRSVPRPGSPLDVMNGSNWSVAPETMSLLIERNRDRLVDKAGKKVDIKDLRCDFTLEVDLLMRGTNPAFKGKITAHGKIDMHVVGGQLPLGNDWIPYEGTGTLTYAVEPIGAAPCTFTYKGRGRFLAGASMSVKFPIKASELKVTVAPKLDGIPKDKLVARGCPGGAVTVKPVSLLTLFYADRLGRDWVIDDWDPTTTFIRSDKFIGHYAGHCARSLCDERDTFILAEAPNGP